MGITLCARVACEHSDRLPFLHLTRRASGVEGAHDVGSAIGADVRRRHWGRSPWPWTPLEVTALWAHHELSDLTGVVFAAVEVSIPRGAESPRRAVRLAPRAWDRRLHFAPEIAAR